MCKCNSIDTGRCWLEYDQWWFEKNFKRLQVGDRLAVYTFALLERHRLREKEYKMRIYRCDVITPDYCEQGCVFQTEGERAQQVAAFAAAQATA